MNRLIRRVLGRGFIALVAAIMVLAMLAPSAALAGTPYTIHWVLLRGKDSCTQGDIVEGSAFFHVNRTPLPTYEVPGAFTTYGDGWSNEAEAPFDSVLLRPGTNDFFFGVTALGGDNSCVDAQDMVSLVSAPLGLNKPLFNIRRVATGFAGSTTLGLSLA